MQCEIIDLYKKFLSTVVSPETGTIHSYVRAVKIVDNVLREQTDFLRNGESVWDIHDENRLKKVLAIIKEERAKPEFGIFKIEKSVSYIKKNFCSAAVQMFREFVLSGDVTQEILDETATIDNGVKVEKKAIEKLKISENKILEAFNNQKEGKERVQIIMARVNQRVFRKFVLFNFQNRCCLTGVDIPEVLRASHIVAWKKDWTNRLNPENGLCLSATYDAAFDRHLISFDKDYRMIVSKYIKEFYTNEAVMTYFQKMEGHRIEMPVRFMPSQVFLEKHRENLVK